ncbi:2486_t:CDS:2 [Paraglomus brasilianum]|uniref:2486_t:CDS:1 n=1 Tax=Paraglomus brasilianum TaxID=144538 RepID=A0A9N9BPM4_9GLOM|nr:2486_t:CDS:2 [Paraglomus brasilianum]
MFGMYKASNAVKISNKEANKAEISNEALKTDSSVYIVKSIKKRARNIIDLNEGEQYERANNKDRNGVNTEIQNVNYESAGAAALSVLPTVKLYHYRVIIFTMVNQKRETHCEDNESNVNNKNEQINDERKDDCAQTGGYPDYRIGGFLSSSIIGNCESQAANCAENGNISSPAIHYRNISDFPWTDTGELKAGDDEFENLHACRQYKAESRLFDWW